MRSALVREVLLDTLSPGANRVDVLVVAALPEELAAARAAASADGPDGAGVVEWTERDVGGSAPFLHGLFRTAGGESFSVALARPTAMAGREIAPLVTTLTDALRPAVVAMCGLCAGNPANTALGDVVVAEPVYEWDEGAHTGTSFEADHRQFRLDHAWTRAAQDFDPSGLACHGPVGDPDARSWLLERLYLGQDPRAHPARSRYFPPGRWQPGLAGLEAEGLIDRDLNGAARLTDAGVTLVRRLRYDDVDGPQRLPFAMHVAPMASGNAVMTDGGIWPRLQKLGMRKIAAVEMEAATVATVAHQRHVPRWLVVKGVMDHADSAKDNRYRAFAARASAQVLFALLDQLVPALSSAPAAPTAARLGGSEHRRGHRPIYSVPPPEPGDIARPGIARDLIDRLTSADAGLVAMTTALAGAGGFGKTTMARMLVHDAEVRSHFSDGILWVTLGEDLAGPALADAIDNACAAVTGAKPPFTDPTAAGAALSAALGDGRFLLVVDDVWHPEQLEPLLNGGPNTVRLITTRRRSLVPSDGSRVDVDAMTAMEARGLLTAGLGEVPESAQADLLRMTGRWPVLLGLINGAAGVDVRHGAKASAALLDIRDSLQESGLTALDPGNPHSRAGAVSATVGVSLDRLDAHERRRFHELAIFPEDVDAPISVIARYWAHTGGTSGARTSVLLRTLADLSLLASYNRNDPPSVRLHDVIRSFLRDAVADDLTDLHARFLDAHRNLLVGGGWWQTPATEAYLWTWIPVHLAGAGLREELRRTVLHPRWLTVKLDGPGAAAVAADLALSRNNDASYLEGVIRQNAHLLGRLGPPGAAAATLASRIRPGTPAAEVATDLVEAFDTPQLVATSGLPDLPQPALIRVLTRDGRRPGPLAVTPDGSVLVSASADGAVDLWNGDTGAEIRTWQHGGHVIALEMSADGSWLASAGKGVRTWDLAMEVERHVLTGPTSEVTCLASTPDAKLLIGGDTDGVVWVWDTATGAVRHRLAEHRAAVQTLAVSPDGALLASAGGSPYAEKDTAVRLWDLTTGTLLRELPGHAGPVRLLEFSPDTAWLASAGMDDAIRFWDTRTGTSTWEIPSGTKFVDALVVSADGTWLAAAGGSLMDSTAGFVGVWDLDESGPRLRWRASGLAEQFALARSPEEDLLLSGGGTLDGRGADNFVRVWDVASGDLHSTLVGHGNGVSGIVAPGHGRWAATTANDGTVRVWRYETSAAPPTEASVAMVAGDPDGTWLATAGEATVQVRDTATGAVDRVLDVGDRKIEALAVAPDGSWLATAGQDRLIRIWETATWRPAHELGPHSFWVTSLAPVGSRTVVACDGSIRLWDLLSGAEVAEPEFTGLEEPLRVVAAAPGLAWFAGGGGEVSSKVMNPVVIRDLTTGIKYIQPAHRRDVSALVSAPDGSWLASTGDNRVLVWEPSTGRTRHELTGGDQLLRLLLVDPGGAWLAAAGQDGRVWVWDPVAGELKHVFSGHAGPVRALAVLAGRLLVSAGDDCSVRVWDPATGATVCAIRVDGPLAALASHGLRVQAGGARGCYFFRLTG